MSHRTLFRISLFSIFLSLATDSFAGDFAPVSFSGGRNFTFTERTDLRRYENGAYKGLTSREIRAFVEDVSTREEKKSGHLHFTGDFAITQKTKRNMQSVLPQINLAEECNFEMEPNVWFVQEERIICPEFRNFPVMPEEKIKAGESWTGESYRLVDPFDKAVFTKIPMLVRYTYLRDSSWNGEDVYVVKAEWATRYGLAYLDEDGDENLVGASGKHVANLYISKKSGMMLLCNDTVDETFNYSNGKSVGFRGTISLFTEFSPHVDKKEIAKTIEDVKLPELEGEKGGPGPITLEQTKAGIKLTLNNLQFNSDSAELLPGETQRLDLIADVLKKSPKSLYMIAGHCADTGNPRAQQKLSEERAQKIAQELIKRGIPSEQILCKGFGATKQLASNDTPEGMAKNRRVEITVLE